MAEHLLNIFCTILLIFLIIATIILGFLGVYFFIRYCIGEFECIKEWKSYFEDKYIKRSKALESSYEKRLKDETEKILMEFYKNDPDNPKNKKAEENQNV